MRRWGAITALILLLPAMIFGPCAPAMAQSASSVDAQLGDYVLGPGDKVRVNVYGEESLSGEFLVSSNGKMALPLVGDVDAGGLTVKAFQDGVVKALSNGYLKQPQVSVEILTYRPFFILGEVDKPGQYPYTAGLTVLNAVATAGGFTYRANKGRVFIKHLNQSEEQALPLEGTTPVLPGDTIRITERFF